MAGYSPKTKTTPEQRRLKRARASQFETNEQILITQVVGSVMPDSQGEHSMIQTAYLVAAEFIENNAMPDQPIDLTWEINGAHFNAQYYPKQDNGYIDDVPTA